jgi:hypothetical protein
MGNCLTTGQWDGPMAKPACDSAWRRLAKLSGYLLVVMSRRFLQCISLIQLSTRSLYSC